MAKYIAYFNVSVKQVFTYKTDFLLYMAINTVFFYVSIALWGAVFNANGGQSIGSYDLTNTITYYLITGLLFRLDLSNSMFLGEEIWSGYFTNDLIKPWYPIVTHFAYTLSDLIVGLITYFPFFVFMFFTAFKYINIPSITNLLLFAIIAVLSLIMNFCFNLILHSLTLHFGDQSSQIDLVNYLTAFLAGAFVPISFLTGWIYKIFMVLPFKFQFFVPTEVYLGKVSFSQSISYIIETIVWIMVFYGIYWVVYRTGLKKYTGTGR